MHSATDVPKNEQLHKNEEQNCRKEIGVEMNFFGFSQGNVKIIFFFAWWNQEQLTEFGQQALLSPKKIKIFLYSHVLSSQLIFT